jgi:hypothetical protein
LNAKRIFLASAELTSSSRSTITTNNWVHGCRVTTDADSDWLIYCGGFGNGLRDYKAHLVAVTIATASGDVENERVNSINRNHGNTCRDYKVFTERTLAVDTITHNNSPLIKQRRQRNPYRPCELVSHYFSVGMN